MNIVTRIINSIVCRYRLYSIKMFSWHPMGLRLKLFKNRYRGKRCFIIGNGPSLSSKDLDVLEQYHEVTFAFNRIFKIFHETKWRPTYYISHDEKMLKPSEHDVSNKVTCLKLIPIQFKWFYDIHIKGATYFNLISKGKKGNPIMSDDISRGVENSNTVACSAIQVAVYMGFKEIYLLGVDHNFSVYQNAKGEVVRNSTIKDYFSEDYNQDKKDLYIPNLDLSTVAYIAAKGFTETKGVKVFNATRGGRLEVFPRVDFNSLF